MAGSRPTRSWNVVFSAMTESTTPGTLSPCLIAPKYELYTVDKGNTYLSEYTGVAVSNKAYPNHVSENTIDVNSVSALLTNTVLQSNTTPITGTKKTGTKKIGTANSIQLSEVIAGSSATDTLNGLYVQKGDEVAITSTVNSTTSTVYATVTGISQEIIAASIVDPSPLANNTGSGALSIDEDASFTGSKEETYVVKVTADSTTTATTVAIEYEVISESSGIRLTATCTKGETFALGTSGVSVVFEEGGDFKLGDIFVFTATPQTAGGYNTISISTTLDTDVTDVEVIFYTTALTSAYYEVADGYVSITQASISISGDVYVTISSGASLLVKSGDLHVAYRELVPTSSLGILSAADSDTYSLVGDIHPDNPLGFMYFAAALAGTSSFYLYAPNGTEATDYATAISTVAKYDGIYSIITYDQSDEVRAALLVTMDYYNGATVAKDKKTWFIDDLSMQEDVLTKDSNGSPIFGDISSEGYLNIEPGDMISAGVVQGDYVTVYNVLDETTGNYSNKTYEIAEVVDVDTCLLTNATELTMPSRVTFERHLTTTEYAEVLAAKASAWDDYHINYVWVDSISIGDYTDVDKVYILATLAAMRAANAPHAPLSEVTIPGVTINESVYFSDEELDILNEGSVWVVNKDLDGNVITVHQVTTVQDGTKAEEDSAVSNVHSILRSLREATMNVKGNCNVTDTTLARLSTSISIVLDYFKTTINDDYLGAQLSDYTVNYIGVNPDNDAGIILNITLDVPEPFLDGSYNFYIV